MVFIECLGATSLALLLISSGIEVPSQGIGSFYWRSSLIQPFAADPILLSLRFDDRRVESLLYFKLTLVTTLIIAVSLAFSEVVDAEGIVEAKVLSTKYQRVHSAYWIVE